jgi:hypothetical protein
VCVCRGMCRGMCVCRGKNGKYDKERAGGPHARNERGVAGVL